MRSKKRKAVTLAKATAQKYNQQNESYRNCALKSSDNFKEKIGGLLLCLEAIPIQEQEERYWKLFESKLRRYIELKVGGITL